MITVSRTEPHGLIIVKDDGMSPLDMTLEVSFLRVAAGAQRAQEVLHLEMDPLHVAIPVSPRGEDLVAERTHHAWKRGWEGLSGHRGPRSPLTDSFPILTYQDGPNFFVRL